LIVPADSPIKSLAEPKSRTFAIGAPSSTPKDDSLTTYHVSAP